MLAEADADTLNSIITGVTSLNLSNETDETTPHVDVFYDGEELIDLDEEVEATMYPVEEAAIHPTSDGLVFF